MSFVLLGILNSQASGAGAGALYRFQLLGLPNNNRIYGMDLDSSSNLIVTGLSDPGQAIIKLLPDATKDFENTYSLKASTGDVTVDSTDSIIFIGQTQDGGLVKYDSTENIIWQVSLVGSSTDRFESVVVDSLDNIYAVGTTYDTTSSIRLILVAKYNSSGTLQWQRTLGNSEDATGRAVAVDSNNDVIVTGFKENPSSDDSIITAKYNSSGTLQWQNILDSGTNNDIAFGVATDSNNNVYICGQGADSSAVRQFFIAKYNSSGFLQWQNFLIQGTTFTVYFKDITINSQDEIFVAGSFYDTDNSAYNSVVVKYDTSGNIVWQRIIGGSASDEFNAITSDDFGDIYIGGDTKSAGEKTRFDMFIAAVPGDGSLTGSYTLDGDTISYLASSFTASSGTLSLSSGSLISATGTLTTATPTGTVDSVTFTNTFTEL